MALRKAQSPDINGKQAAKSKATQDKIVNAVIGLIQEKGFASASSTEIARRAGVTWGAVQHHFGGKEEILEEVLERSHRAFQQTLGDVSFARGSPEERVSKYVDAAWAHYRGAEYMATLEILLASRGHGATAQALSVGRSREEHLLLGRQIFHDSSASRPHLLEAIYIVHCMLTGILIETVLEGSGFNARVYTRHLKKIVAGLLYPAGAVAQERS
ncbi:MAG: TetR/AcrR family transcriptional regulator [Halioglobus sp.]